MFLFADPSVRFLSLATFFISLLIAILVVDLFKILGKKKWLKSGLVILVALIFIFTGLILYLAKDQRRRTAGINLAILGIGLIGFTYYELVLNRATNDLFVGAVGHEIGELLYLLFFYQQFNNSTVESYGLTDGKNYG